VGSSGSLLAQMPAPDRTHRHGSGCSLFAYPHAMGPVLLQAAPDGGRAVVFGLQQVVPAGWYLVRFSTACRRTKYMNGCCDAVTTSGIWHGCSQLGRSAACSQRNTSCMAANVH
jgi:hypothetical protein